MDLHWETDCKASSSRTKRRAVHDLRLSRLHFRVSLEGTVLLLMLTFHCNLGVERDQRRFCLAQPSFRSGSGQADVLHKPLKWATQSSKNSSQIFLAIQHDNNSLGQHSKHSGQYAPRSKFSSTLTWTMKINTGGFGQCLHWGT